MIALRLGILYSGGKDSTYALYLLLQQGFEIACLITLRPESPESYMFHHPNINLTQLQAEAMGLPLISTKTTGRKEEELQDLSETLREAKKEINLQGVATGAIDSDYQKTRVDRIADECELRSYSPLWRKSPILLLREQVSIGFKTIFSGVYAHGFTRDWLGKPLNEDAVIELARMQERFGIHPSGEGGEYESLVLDAPVFKQRLCIDESKTNWRESAESGTFEVLRAHLEAKAA